MKTMEAITNRQSCRSYTEEQLTESELQTILQAANAAPLAFGGYDEIKLTVIQNKELLAKLDAAGAKLYGNPKLVRHFAPTLILVSFKTNGRKPGFLATFFSEDKPDPYPYCNVGCIVENMALAATDLGLGNVILGGPPLVITMNPELSAELKIPQGFMPGTAIALGKAAMPLKERELTVAKMATDIFN
jgi:nitroreductase